MFKTTRIATFIGMFLFCITNAQAITPFGTQVRGNDLETGKRDEVGGVGDLSATVSNLPEYRAEAGLGGATFTPVLKAEAFNPNAANSDDRTSSTSEAYQRFQNSSATTLDVVLDITLDASFTSTGPAADSFALADVWVYGGSGFEVIESPICPNSGLARAIMLGDAYFCGQNLARANMFLETDPAQASSNGTLVRTLTFSVAPGEFFGIYGILRANAVAGSSDAFNTLSMEFDAASAAILEASGVPETTEISAGIDIRPHSPANKINPRSRGKIPVAILGSSDFDALQVDSSTVSFGPDGALPRGNGRARDVNHDGFMDLVFRFKTRATGISCDDTEATLIAALFDGTQVVGTDTLSTVGCNNKKHGWAYWRKHWKDYLKRHWKQHD